MLIKANEKDLQQISEFCKGSIMGAKIFSLADCYKFGYGFLDIMLSVDDDTKDINAVISVFDGNVTIHAKDKFNSEEVSGYLGMIYYNCITAEKTVMDKLGFTAYTEKTAYRFVEGESLSEAESAEEDEHKAVYNLISDNIPDSFVKDNEAYLCWLSDYMYRKNRGYARIKCIKQDGRVVACAMTSAECSYAALISGVASDANHRKRGAGKSVVLTLANELKNENKQVYVIALNESAKSFYEHIGFEFDGVIAIKER